MKKITFILLGLFLSIPIHSQLTNGNFTDEVDARIKNFSI